MDYPLEHDHAASQAGTQAEKDSTRFAKALDIEDFREKTLK